MQTVLAVNSSAISKIIIKEDLLKRLPLRFVLAESSMKNMEKLSSRKHLIVYIALGWITLKLIIGEMS